MGDAARPRGIPRWSRDGPARATRYETNVYELNGISSFGDTAFPALSRTDNSGGALTVQIVARPDLDIGHHESLRCPAGVRHRDSDRGALVAEHLSARCHWRACRLQALRDPRSILVGEW
jgi:hypothetical protein